MHSDLSTKKINHHVLLFPPFSCLTVQKRTFLMNNSCHYSNPYYAHHHPCQNPARTKIQLWGLL